MSIPIPIELARYRGIEPGCIYKDEYSLEKRTGVIKRKYKLAGYWSEHLRSMDARIFFVSTSKNYKVGKSTVVKITTDDYDECVFKVIRNCDSYYDVSEPLVMTKAEIEKKTCDPNNGFKNIARLKRKSFGRFLSVAHRIKVQARPPVGVEKIRNIIESLAPEEIRDEELKELHLL